MVGRGRPKIYTRTRIRAIIKDAKGRNVSLRQYCKDEGLAYVSVEVAKGRYGLRTGKRTRTVAQS
jgi:hypothetical protein